VVHAHIPGACVRLIIKPWPWLWTRAEARPTPHSDVTHHSYSTASIHSVGVQQHGAGGGGGGGGGGGPRLRSVRSDGGDPSLRWVLLTTATGLAAC
jgi:hypothetical protein